MLKKLCSVNSASGDEAKMREFITGEIKDFCTYEIDALGSVIAFKKGKKTPNKKVMFAAHMDEVGFIVTHITDDGYLKFAPVGGVDARVVIDRVVTVSTEKGNLKGVIGAKAPHLLNDDEKKTAPKFSNLYIDIGAKDKSDAENYVATGDYVYFDSEYEEFGNGFIKAKALDDRIGCMLLIELIKSDLEYDTYFCFNVQEEVGLRGSTCTAFGVGADVAVILEATTAADLDGVRGGERCCVLGEGPVVSYMDGRTVYDKGLFNLAFDIAKEKGIKIQTKTTIAGGNDAGAIQTAGKGAKVMAVSLPARYIHASASVVKKADITETEKLLFALTEKIYD